MGKRTSFFFAKLFHYEFWPFWFFYIPMYFYGLYLAMKSGSFMYFTTTNPGMKYSGVMGESKYKVLSSIPREFVPQTIFIPRSTSYPEILNLIRGANLKYPLIIKPDVGERGKDVEKIEDPEALRRYLVGKKADLNLQEFIDFDLEFGILYHRTPGADAGNITSVVQKGFLHVTGDGVRTLTELMKQEIRIANRLDYFEEKYKTKLSVVLPPGEKFLLEPIGNHCRGTTFYNANHLINNELLDVFDKIALQIDGYFYGRFDLKVASLENLYKGKDIKIIELNGVSSEVAHIYDPEYKLLPAYRDVFTHMKYIYQIAKENHASGYPYDSLGKFLYDLKMHLKNK
ncbi:MAG: hypothetical protein MI975_19125 [Cytophagales bacterium]|nr:hypothetical protein [Cytophagales bacterium]